MANFQSIWAKTLVRNQMRMCLDTCEKTDVEKYRNVRQKQRSVRSICTITLLADKSLLHLTRLAMCACQVHPSIPAPVCQASTQGQKTGTHSQKLCQEGKKKSREMVKMRQIMQREKRNHRFSVFFNSPFPTFSCGNDAFRSLALHPDL